MRRQRCVASVFPQPHPSTSSLIPLFESMQYKDGKPDGPQTAEAWKKVRAIERQVFDENLAKYDKNIDKILRIPRKGSSGRQADEGRGLPGRHEAGVAPRTCRRM